MPPNVLAEAPGIEMRAEPLGENCERIWQRAEHALVGISTGNSYFNQERLTALLDWAGNHYGQIDVVYVDTALDDMLLADGRTPESAARSVKGTVRDARRRIRRAVEKQGPRAERFRVRALSELLELPEYRAVRERTDRAFEEDAEFTATCEAMVQEVVAHRGDSAITEAHLRAGLAYVQAEAPLFTDCPAIFGVSASVVLYHMRTPISEYLAGDPQGFRAAPGQGFVIVRPAEPALATV
ncbi:tRNA-dependent cyclodipeptide synthase [Streptomyces sp. AV19]|uniref:tRNA-dependent cyclodipeptide synthase n=1 Tax=Streptomyces sp. AV19 TaxID=2793068 RepID=UPI0018FE3E26|nr:tRNA-dependent cyclodipeptide synthase [Streptomyces sp. AV19]MBH1937655.1 tRNA-dependent cyclodipeptide synthase [Streptomyces sp. AV19]MDG4536324.1 tRNA-dependent cyclodipeptide synthase [Streptomyces sp. AV19]